MTVWRPCDAVESHVAWVDALERRSGPTSLVLTRQALPHNARTETQLADVRRGGYVLVDSDEAPELVLIATGSEVALAVESAKVLTAAGRRVRVVSMPCTSLFDAQPESYRDAVLPRGVPRVAIEAGVRNYWCQYTGDIDRVVGIDTFGASAPAKDLFRHFGFTAEHIVAVAGRALGA